MLDLNLHRCFTVRAVSCYDENNELKFNPPVYEQRYGAVVKILEHEYWRGKMKKVIDFGCAEMKLLPLLKRVDGVEHILEVDIDEELLKPYVQRAKPLISDYIGRRKRPLRIDIYKGSVDSPVNCIRNTDAVIAVELIEHLYPDVFEQLPFNIFGFIKPKLILITTPNAEFNVLFNLNLPNGFRHPDHKFEWSRKQFKDWCLNICERFPNYGVSIIGIGRGPPETRKYGCVSQMAVFVRKDVLKDSLVEELRNDLSPLSEYDYKLIFSVEFPYAEDNRDNNHKILDEAKYHIGRYTGMGDRYWNVEKNIYEIPFSAIFDCVFPIAINENELKEILVENKYEIQNNFILIEDEPQTSDEEDNENFGERSIRSDLNLTEDDEENWDSNF